MHEFTELETLEIDYRVFHGPTIESRERGGNHPRDSESGYAIWTPEATPSLFKILPQSLQRFDLIFPEIQKR